ncbi:hypothetical protein SARC_00856 [Sphaeroforma arctica JP610]|uniref:Uncharacterized protein n=1 Tax=Sphaeroforma arctica JP610 TaxID=667725 RepID=A0A0L0GFE3_9EUKA|nr:hypothetical protein SARC_00856 [Sphaeroforma arctica JP610]KNC87003.1 hypothetical protein SARC_00856 [Sphaeroforma arctica JP610]|eukprot:XP_014160905.1 hypothetical protein SARC_00856 [Sphaeroforma arctica JP610]
MGATTTLWNPSKYDKVRGIVDTKNTGGELFNGLTYHVTHKSQTVRLTTGHTIPAEGTIIEVKARKESNASDGLVGSLHENSDMKKALQQSKNVHIHSKVVVAKARPTKKDIHYELSEPSGYMHSTVVSQGECTCPIERSQYIVSISTPASRKPSKTVELHTRSASSVLSDVDYSDDSELHAMDADAGVKVRQPKSSNKSAFRMSWTTNEPIRVPPSCGVQPVLLKVRPNRLNSNSDYRSSDSRCSHASSIAECDTRLGTAESNKASSAERGTVGLGDGTDSFKVRANTHTHALSGVRTVSLPARSSELSALTSVPVRSVEGTNAGPRDTTSVGTANTNATKTHTYAHTHAADDDTCTHSTPTTDPRTHTNTRTHIRTYNCEQLTSVPQSGGMKEVKSNIGAKLRRGASAPTPVSRPLSTDLSAKDGELTLNSRETHSGQLSSSTKLGKRNTHIGQLSSSAKLGKKTSNSSGSSISPIHIGAAASARVLSRVATTITAKHKEIDEEIKGESRRERDRKVIEKSKCRLEESMIEEYRRRKQAGVAMSFTQAPALNVSARARGGDRQTGAGAKRHAESRGMLKAQHSNGSDTKASCAEPRTYKKRPRSACDGKVSQKYTDTAFIMSPTAQQPTGVPRQVWRAMHMRSLQVHCAECSTAPQGCDVHRPSAEAVAMQPVTRQRVHGVGVDTGKQRVAQKASVSGRTSLNASIGKLQRQYSLMSGGSIEEEENEFDFRSVSPEGTAIVTSHAHYTALGQSHTAERHSKPVPRSSGGGAVVEAQPKSLPSQHRGDRLSALDSHTDTSSPHPHSDPHTGGVFVYPSEILEHLSCRCSLVQLSSARNTAQGQPLPHSHCCEPNDAYDSDTTHRPHRLSYNRPHRGTRHRSHSMTGNRPRSILHNRSHSITEYRVTSNSINSPLRAATRTGMPLQHRQHRQPNGHQQHSSPHRRHTNISSHLSHTRSQPSPGCSGINTPTHYTHTRAYSPTQYSGSPVGSPSLDYQGFAPGTPRQDYGRHPTPQRRHSGQLSSKTQVPRTPRQDYGRHKTRQRRHSGQLSNHRAHVPGTPSQDYDRQNALQKRHSGPLSNRAPAQSWSSFGSRAAGLGARNYHRSHSYTPTDVGDTYTRATPRSSDGSVHCFPSPTSLIQNISNKSVESAERDRAGATVTRTRSGPQMETTSSYTGQDMHAHAHTRTHIDKHTRDGERSLDAAEHRNSRHMFYRQSSWDGRPLQGALSRVTEEHHMGAYAKHGSSSGSRGVFRRSYSTDGTGNSNRSSCHDDASTLIFEPSEIGGGQPIKYTDSAEVYESTASNTETDEKSGSCSDLNQLQDGRTRSNSGNSADSSRKSLSFKPLIYMALQAKRALSKERASRSTTHKDVTFSTETLHIALTNERETGELDSQYLQTVQWSVQPQRQPGAGPTGQSDTGHSDERRKSSGHSENIADVLRKMELPIQARPGVGQAATGESDARQLTKRTSDVGQPGHSTDVLPNMGLLGLSRPGERQLATGESDARQLTKRTSDVGQPGQSTDILPALGLLVPPRSCVRRMAKDESDVEQPGHSTDVLPYIKLLFPDRPSAKQLSKGESDVRQIACGESDTGQTGEPTNALPDIGQVAPTEAYIEQLPTGVSQESTEGHNDIAQPTPIQSCIQPPATTGSDVRQICGRQQKSEQPVVARPRPATRRKRVIFDEIQTAFLVPSSHTYDRSTTKETDFTISDVDKVYIDLMRYKLLEMEVHAHSYINTNMHLAKVGKAVLQERQQILRGILGEVEDVEDVQYHEMRRDQGE